MTEVWIRHILRWVGRQSTGKMRATEFPETATATTWRSVTGIDRSSLAVGLESHESFALCNQQVAILRPGDHESPPIPLSQRKSSEH